MSTPAKFNAGAKWLHWLVAFFVILMLIFGRTLESLPLEEREQIIMGHSGLGTLVLILMLIRLLWRWTHEPPGAVETMSDLQTKLSTIVHWALYVLLILQPIFGILQAAYLTDYEVMAHARRRRHGPGVPHCPQHQRNGAVPAGPGPLRCCAVPPFRAERRCTETDAALRAC